MGATSLAWKGTENTLMCYFLFHDLCHLLQAFNLLAYMTEIPQVPQGMWSVRPNPLTPQSWKTVHIKLSTSLPINVFVVRGNKLQLAVWIHSAVLFFPIWHVFNGWRKKMKEKELDSMTWNNNMKLDLRWPQSYWNAAKLVYIFCLWLFPCYSGQVEWVVVTALRWLCRPHRASGPWLPLSERMAVISAHQTVTRRPAKVS